MHTFYGIWIDHAQAHIIKANKMGEMEIQTVESDVESKHHGTQNEEHLSVVNQHRDEEHRHNEMKAFAKEVITLIQDADEILIFGPSTAKHEFKHELETHKALAEKLKGVETADQLSPAELKAFVKKFFKLPQA